MSDLKTEIIVRSIKIFAISYFLVLAFIFSYLIATYIDKPENQLKVYYQRLKDQISKKLNGRL